VQIPPAFATLKKLPEFVQAPSLEWVIEPPGALAATENLEPPAAVDGACVLTVIAWFAFAIWNVLATLAAALYVASPGCDAVIVHDPAPLRRTVVPLTVQSPIALKATVRLEVAVALIVKSASPKVLSASGAKAIAWVASEPALYWRFSQRV
jgi:hypothetical protein